MKKKKKLLISLGVVLAVAFISGMTMLAATNLGTSSDPLVTLSYLTEKFKPEVMSSVDESIKASETSLSASLGTKISEFETNIDKKLSETERLCKPTPFQW